MAIRDRHKLPRQPPRDLESSARPLLSPRELSARRADQRRRRRRRRILFATLTVLLLVVLYSSVSYANYMLKPTSETLAERSAEWVRDDVPFGNWIIDTAEHYTASPPSTSPTHPHQSDRCSPLLCRAKGSGAVPVHPSMAARRCW